MTQPTIINGYGPDDFVPGTVAKNEFGAGKTSVGQAALKCVLYGNKTSAGTVANATKVPVTTPEEADTYFGVRSELARMCEAALDIPGVTLEAIAVAEAAGAAATVTLTITGTFSTAGSIKLQIDECVFIVNFAASDNTVTLAAAAVVLAANGAKNGRLPTVASNLSGVVTLTVASVGARGNQHTAYIVDQSLRPTGMTLVLAGGTALSNGGIPFTGGSGTDDIDAALTATVNEQQDYIALAHNDATNVGKIETSVNAKAAFDVGLLEQYVVALNGNQGSAIAIGKTQMNDVLGSCFWAQFHPEHPSRLAARLAALFSTVENADPNHNYDNEELPGAAPHFNLKDSPTRALMKSSLSQGIAPLKTVNGKLQIVRAIQSHCLNGAIPDYRTLDRSEATVPIRMRKEVVALDAQLREENPYAGPDLENNALPPEGTITPTIWGSHVLKLLKEKEAANWLTAVDSHPPQPSWDSDGERIMAVVPNIVKQQNHQTGVIVRQQAS